MTLKRGAPIARRTPLRSKTELKRTELKRSANLRRVGRMKKSAPKPAITPRKRRALAERSYGSCEMGIVGFCTQWATEAAHRAGRGAGGRHGDAAEVNSRLSNYVHACGPCHAWTHRFPKSAELNGWMLPKNADGKAHEIPVRIAGVWSLLDDEGGVTPCASS